METKTSSKVKVLLCLLDHSIILTKDNLASIAQLVWFAHIFLNSFHNLTGVILILVISDVPIDSESVHAYVSFCILLHFTRRKITWLIKIGMNINNVVTVINNVVTVITMKLLSISSSIVI